MLYYYSLLQFTNEISSFIETITAIITLYTLQTT